MAYRGSRRQMSPRSSSVRTGHDGGQLVEQAGRTAMPVIDVQVHPRQLHGYAVAPVVALQAQSLATQGRSLSTLAPLRALRARTPDPAWSRPVVGEGVTSCPRAGCGNGATAELVRHRQTKGAAIDM